MPVRKKIQKGLKVLNFAHLLVFSSDIMAMKGLMNTSVSSASTLDEP